MTNSDYILSNANLPFDISGLDDEGQALLNAAPVELWNAFNRARNHELQVCAGDEIALWIENNWRTVLPAVAARFTA